MNWLNPYSLIMDLRNKYYDVSENTQVILNRPVVSVGNITTGGSGKTPFIMYLIELLNRDRHTKSKLNVLVVSKSYKASLNKPQEVILDFKNAISLFGDEPCLIKQKYPDIFVWSGPSKSKTAEAALSYYQTKNIKIDLILIDDGFSHRRLKRNLDIVLIDTSQSLKHYQMLPFGHLRENFKSLTRAQLIILTKVNQADPQVFNFLKEKLQKMNLNFIESNLLTTLNSAVADNTTAFAFSGVANPLSFEKSLSDHKVHTLDHIKFPDHMMYTLENQNQIYQRFLESKAQVLITTAKDAVKINHPELIKSMLVLSVKISISNSEEVKINETICKLL